MCEVFYDACVDVAVDAHLWDVGGVCLCLPAITVIEKDSRINFNNTVPDGCGEIFGESLDGIIKEGIGIDSVIFLPIK